MKDKVSDVIFNIAPDFAEMLGHKEKGKKEPPLEAEVIGDVSLPVKEYNGVRVVTFKDIDTVHRRPDGTASRNFRQNRKHFIEGEDYFKVCADEIRRDKITDISAKTHEDVILITESGYLMITKSFKDDLAWEVQRKLVNIYFKAKRADAAINNLSPQTQAMINLEVRQNELKKRVDNMESRLEQLFIETAEPEPDPEPQRTEPKKWSEREKDYLRKAYALGQSDVEIAADLSRTIMSISNERRKLGLVGKTSKRWTDGEDKKLIRLHNKRVSYADIAAVLDKTADSVGNRLKLLRKKGMIRR